MYDPAAEIHRGGGGVIKENVSSDFKGLDAFVVPGDMLNAVRKNSFGTQASAEVGGGRPILRGGREEGRCPIPKRLERCGQRCVQSRKEGFLGLSVRKRCFRFTKAGSVKGGDS